MWISILSALLTILRPLAEYFGATARLGRLQLRLASVRARQELEAERLKAEYAEIHRRGDKTATDLADALTHKPKED